MGCVLCTGKHKDEDSNTTPPSPEQRTGQQGTGSSIAATTAISHEGTITSRTAVMATGQRPGKEESSSSGTAAIAAGQRRGNEEASSSGTAATATEQRSGPIGASSSSTDTTAAGQRPGKEESSSSGTAAIAAGQRRGNEEASSSGTAATATEQRSGPIGASSSSTDTTAAERRPGKEEASSSETAALVAEGDSLQVAIKVFTYEELAFATSNFSPDFLLGLGKPSRFYWGNLETDNQVVAIKRLDRSSPQVMEIFLFEATVQSKLDHSNLVKVIGHCAHEEERLLVYEYMPLGSLEDHLYGRTPGKQLLDWTTRMKIALGAAKGLEYLHDKCNPPIIHGDFKSSNILLGHGYDPKLSEFGIKKLGHDRDQIHGLKTSDILHFGIVLLELITGKRSADIRDIVISLRFFYLEQKQNILQMADPNLDYPLDRLPLALDLISECLHIQPYKRPSVASVVQSLQRLLSGTDAKEIEFIEDEDFVVVSYTCPK